MENDLVIKGLNQSALTFLMQAEYSTSEVDTDRVDRGFRIERVVKNLTDRNARRHSECAVKIGGSTAHHVPAEYAEASEFCRARGRVACRRGSGESESCARW